MRTIRLFVSSPGDTVDERRRVVRVVERLNAAYSGLIAIEPILWEERFYSAHEGFQPQIAKSVDCDIVVAILRGRLGTPLPPDFASKIPPQERLADDASYASGTAYEILTAIDARRNGKRNPDIFVFRYPNAPSVPLDAADRAEIEAQWQGLKAFAERAFVDPQGHFKGAYQSFVSIDDFETKVEGALRQWVSDNVLDGRAVVWPIATKGSPFRGLEPFGAKHAEVFFGRNDARSRAIEMMKNAAEVGYPFLLVVGPSGSGKSSFARAGIVPWLVKPGAVTGVDAWRVAIMRPADNPHDVIAGLARHLFDSTADIPEAEQGRPIALPELMLGDSATPDALAGLFSTFARGRFERPEDLAAAGRAAMAPLEKALKLAAEGERKQWNTERSQSARLLLIIDQFEEMFSRLFDDEARSSFARLIDRILRTGLVWILATLRSESFDTYLKGPLARLSAPAIEETTDGHGGANTVAAQYEFVFRLLPPGLSEISEAVRGPATAAGLEWDTDPETHQRLDDRLIADIDRPDLLPLVQFVLGRLFEERKTKGDKVMLTYDAYRALGRLDGAIDHEAERAVNTLGAAELAILPRLLRALVTYGSPAEGVGKSTPTLRSAYRKEVAYDTPSTRLIDALVQARILISGIDTHDQQVVSLAHQRVIEAWTRANTIVAESEGVLRVRAEVEQAQQRWQHSGQRRDRLIPAGLPLSEAENAAKALSDELSAATRAYIDKSGRAARLRQRLTAAAAIVFLIVAGVAALEGIWAKQSANRAEQQTKIALANEAHAKNQETIASNSFRLSIASYQRVAYRYTYEKNYDQALKELDTVEGIVRNYISKFRSNDPFWLRQMALIDTQYGEILLAKNDPDAALGRFRQSRKILPDLVDKEPANAEFRADMLEVRVQISHALTLLKREQEAFDELMSAKQAETALPPDSTNNVRLRGHFANLDLDLGDKLLAASRNDEAKDAFADARTLLTAAVAENSKDAALIAGLARSESGVGDALFAKKQFSEAAPIYADAIKNFRAAASLETTNMARASDVIKADYKFGQNWWTLGKPDLALAAYGDAVAAIADGVSKWPDNTIGWGQAFVFAQTTIAQILASENKLPEALAAVRLAQDRARELAAAKSVDNDSQISLGTAYVRIGSVLLSEKQYELSIATLRQGLELFQSVLKNNPDNKLARNDECATLETWADALVADSKDDEAVAKYRDAVVSCTKLIAPGPAESDNIRVVANIDGKIGEMLARKHDNEGAAKAYQDALDLLERFVPLHPEDMAGRGALAWTYGMLGGVNFNQGKWSDSSLALQKSVSMEQSALHDDAATARSWPWLEYFPRGLGQITFKLELIKQFQVALVDADLALSILPNDISIAANRAHALMLLGRTDEARAIYLAHHGEQVGERIWEKVLLDDFDALRNAGLSNPLMDEMKMFFAARP